MNRPQPVSEVLVRRHQLDRIQGDLGYIRRIYVRSVDSEATECHVEHTESRGEVRRRVVPNADEIVA